MPADPSRSALLDLRVTPGAQTVIALHGDLDPATAPSLDAAIATAAEDAATERVVLDLAGLGFLDSSGLRVFVTAREVLRQSGAELALRNPSPNALRLLDITGLSEIITVE